MPPSPDQEAKMKCPTCAVDLKIAERQNVEIDYCPQCRGVWLDRGELDKIIDRTAEPTRAPSTHASPPINGGGMYHGKKKRKGFLSEIFDFD